MPEYNDWFPTSLHGDPAINVMGFGAFGDGIAHPLWGVDDPSTGVPFANLAAAQVVYPSATSMDDYADWCAITEAIKAAFTTDGVAHGGEGFKNKPLCFPAGRYITNKPVVINSVSDALIYGTGYYTQIFNENETAGQNTCVRAEGLRYSRIENFAFGCRGTGAIAFDLTNEGGAGGGFNSHGNVWMTCNFNALGTDSTGCFMGSGGYMGSEQTFIRCTADGNTWGWVVGNPNALSYLFITCLGNLNTEAAIRVNTGGGVTCINCAFSMNGDLNTTGWDIINYANMAVTLISCRSESRRFVNSGGYVFMLGCTQSQNEKDCILVHSDSGARIVTTDCMQSRLEGEGEFTIETSVFAQAGFYITGVTNSGGLVKITHPVFSTSLQPGYEDWDHWRDGDEVEIVQVRGTTYPTAPSVNGAWIINKLNSTSFELVGSTYVADTYLDTAGGEPAGTKGYMKPGPRYHLTNPIGRAPKVSGRVPGLAATKSMAVKWADSGTTFTNMAATGAVTFDLPSTGNTNHRDVRGAHYRFVVLEGFAVTVVVGDGAGTAEYPQARIFRAGGYATAGLQVTSSVVGNSIEIMLVDGEGSAYPSVTPKGDIGHRWLIVSETGTWTISGTPVP